MRNMLQLLGGVAVAGAVAAGSTAFTAGALNASAVTTIVGGGKANVTVTGAQLMSASFVADATYPDHLRKIRLGLTTDGTAAIPANSTVKAGFTGDQQGAATDGTLFGCSVDTGIYWVCTMAGAAATDYFASVDSVDIVVVPTA